MPIMSNEELAERIKDGESDLILDLMAANYQVSDKDYKRDGSLIVKSRKMTLNQAGFLICRQYKTLWLWEDNPLARASA